jgi:hypothetical protein
MTSANMPTMTPLSDDELGEESQKMTVGEYLEELQKDWKKFSIYQGLVHLGGVVLVCAELMCLFSLGCVASYCHNNCGIWPA